MMEVISRVDASRQGARFYFTGEPCKKAGHLSKRRVSDSYCYECCLTRSRELKSLKRIASGVKPRPKTDEERAEARKASLKRYAEKNPDSIKESQRKYQEQNREKWLQQKRKWAKANPVSLRLYEHRRRERTKTGVVSKSTVTLLMALQRGRCVYCEAQIESNYQIDHIVPLAKGGSHVDENIQLLCPVCNRKKGAMHPVDFAQKIGRLL